jgi:hypothetical protein
MATKKQLAARKRLKLAAKKCAGRKKSAFRKCMKKALKRKK